jgi:hypothetical protein
LELHFLEGLHVTGIHSRLGVRLTSRARYDFPIRPP